MLRLGRPTFTSCPSLSSQVRCRVVGHAEGGWRELGAQGSVKVRVFQEAFRHLAYPALTIYSIPLEKAPISAITPHLAPTSSLGIFWPSAEPSDFLIKLFNVRIGILRVACTEHGCCIYACLQHPQTTFQALNRTLAQQKTTTSNTPHCEMTEVFLYLRSFPKFGSPSDDLPKNAGDGACGRERDCSVENIPKQATTKLSKWQAKVIV